MASTEFYQRLSVLELIAAEECTGDIDCRHCFALEKMENLYTFIDEAIEQIELDCKKK